MAAKKNPAAEVVAFFESAPIDTAQTVLAICKGVLARRQPTKTKPRGSKGARAVDGAVGEQTSL